MIFGVAAIALLLGFALVALLSRPGKAASDGPGPVPALPEGDGWLSSIGADRFEEVLVLLLEAMGLEVEQRNAQGGRLDLLAVNRAPITGLRIYVRGIHRSPPGWVGEEEVRAAVDTARAEQAGKAILVTLGGFTPAARAAALGASAELVDGTALAELVRKHLPEVAARAPV